MSAYIEKHNMLFIHVPRTAGTSMERTPFLLPTGGHETIRDYDVPEGTFKFAFVRSPWDRFVFAFFCQYPYRGTGQAEFDKFIKEECKPLVGTGETPSQGIYESHFDPMYHFLLDNDDKIGVDFIGRYEFLKHDWEYVCERLGKFYPLPHIRKFDHDMFRCYYTPESWDIIENIYHRDVELFGYSE